MSNIRDMFNKEIALGAQVVAAFREQNIATLRVGEVVQTGIDYEPNIIRQANTPKVPVIWVQWLHTTHDYLPQRPTKIAARKAIVL